MSPSPHIVFDTELLTHRKDRCATASVLPDFLLQRVAEDLCERLQIVNRTFDMGACIGALNGAVGRRVRKAAQLSTLIDVEPSARLLALCEGPHVQADVEHLPFADGSLDLVVSGLSLQFANDLPGALLQIRRVLKPDGLFLGALLGGETLRELRSAFLAAEAELEGGASPRVAPFADVRDLGGLLQRAGFTLPVADAERLTVTYSNPLALMHEIKAMGASNVLVARRRKPVTRRLLMRAAEIYAEQFGLGGGRVPATFDIITLTAWSEHESQQKPLRPGSARTRLADALGVSEHKLPKTDADHGPKR